MFQKSRVLAVAALATGAIGLGASAASAGIGPSGSFAGPSGDNGGLVNVSHNQVPLQGCGNEVPVNVLGVQVPVDRIAAALGILSTEPAAAAQDSSCKQGSAQNNMTSSATVKKTMSARVYHDPRTYRMSGRGWSWRFRGASGDNGGLVNVSHNQVPLQVCNNRVPVNVLGVQVPVDQVAAALGLLSPGSVVGAQDSSCKQASGQNN